MGSLISKPLESRELEKMKAALENNSLSEVIGQSNINLNLLKNTTLDIAITGESGAGKSALVNALRGMTDFEEGAAETGITETTVESKGYPHPTSPKVTIWDLPGIGTLNFKAKEYLQMVKFEKYDFFMILSSERFTENDVLLAREIQKMKKTFYYVRTKVDVSVDSEKSRPNFSEEETLKKLKKYLCDGLKTAGEPNPRVFLISRKDLNMYDFPLLRETLANDLDDLKRYALITTMPNLSREVLKKKKITVEALIWTASLVSGSVGAIPVPGVSTVCDLGILVGTMIDLCKVFGLDEDSLCRCASRVGKPVDMLRSAIEKSRVANKITPAFVMDLLQKSTLFKTMTAAELVLDYIPVLCSVFGAIGSFATTFYMLTKFVKNLEEDAANVLDIAAEH
ncbi:PREDICTED: interferon-inducible GTPase 5-like [Gekko japonicus]|uniref:Interferon-inducible GTPase 5-like n=1 Tax=Gekko japonicus TaxID=146911 RepID=A0ABM1K9T5_GEKJA|nr:PREDICTED: interferon-inducible GTPase 5-like [Gekko japonicus]